MRRLSTAASRTAASFVNTAAICGCLLYTSYLQRLYEKKLCTYPRTDSRYLTSDMADSLPVLVNLIANAMPFCKEIAITCDPHTVINDKKVTDQMCIRDR